MAYLELLERACATHRSGLYNPGTKELNLRGVSLYLRKEEQFRELLMALLYMTGGQVPRAIELTSIWHKNGEMTERGIYVYRGSIMYVTRYSKAKKSTNKEFVVARFLPYSVG